MNEVRAKLWTIAHRDFVQCLQAAGQAHASWEKVEPRWRPAYRWMLDRMRERGLIDPSDSVDAPPIWAWHSCGGWQHSPSAETVDMLLGIEPANRQGLCLLTWSAPVERLLISHYVAWCDLLDRVVAGEPIAGMESSVVCPPLTIADPPSWWTPSGELQACVYTLDWRDVARVAALPGMVVK